jgi:hypothetical protein
MVVGQVPMSMSLSITGGRTEKKFCDISAMKLFFYLTKDSSQGKTEGAFGNK